MKNLILFFISTFLLTSLTFGQGLVLLDTDENEVTGDTLEIPGDADESPIQKIIFLRNDTDEDIHIMARRIDIDLLSGTVNTFCWSGSCYDPGTDVSQVPMTLAPGQVSTEDDFYVYYYPQGQEGSTVLEFEFFSENEGDFDTVRVTLVFITEQTTGIAGASNPSWSLSSPAPNPARDFTRFNYELPVGTRNASIVIRTITGSLVKETPLDPSASSLRIDTSSFRNGIFLYSLVLDDRVVVTQKFVVNR